MGGGFVCCQLPVHYVGTSEQSLCQFLECKNSDHLLDRYKVPGLESQDFVLMRKVGEEVIGGWMDGWMDQGSESYIPK